ncbi:MAG: hypothetical protein IEMM0003_0305 [bacterium]|nr:MAG: hypothetical protein IEMM0003_0305 [bacterium]
MGILSSISGLLFMKDERVQTNKTMMNKSSEGNKELKETSSIKYRDPVCSMWILPDDAKVSTNYNGEKYYFCSQSCADKFNGSPEKYIKQSNNSQNMSMSGMGSMGSTKKHGRRRGGCC